MIITPFKAKTPEKRPHAPQTNSLEQTPWRVNPGKHRRCRSAINCLGRVTPPPARGRASETVMQVAVPLRDDRNVVRGALALVINPGPEFTRILSVARAGSRAKLMFSISTG